MRAGKLTHTITIERLTETVSPSGHVRKEWAPLATMRAEVKQASASEYLTGFGEADAGNAVFVIRWPGVEIGTADRIVHAGRLWNIKGAVEIGRRRGLELRAVSA